MSNPYQHTGGAGPSNAGNLPAQATQAGGQGTGGDDLQDDFHLPQHSPWGLVTDTDNHYGPQWKDWIYKEEPLAGLEPAKWDQDDRQMRGAKVQGLPDVRDFELAYAPNQGGAFHHDGFRHFTGPLQTGQQLPADRWHDCGTHVELRRADGTTSTFPAKSRFEVLTWKGDRQRPAGQHASLLRTCPIYSVNRGGDIWLAMKYCERQTLQHGSGVHHAVLIGDRKQPPGVVARFEWQARVCVDPNYLVDRGGTNRFANLHGQRLQDRLHEQFLHDLFVRRQRFDKSDGVDRRAYAHNLLGKRIPGRIGTWLTRDWHDERMIQDILDADAARVWPHGKYKTYAVDPATVFERILLERDFRLTELI